MDMKGLVERVDRRLAAKGLTAAEASVRATGTKDTIRNWQRAAKAGKQSGAAVRSIEAVARVLGTNVTWLLHETGPEEGSGTDVHAVEVPLVSWISAGALASDAVADEALGTARAVIGDGDWIALRVEGESMDRISPPGSIIFVDRADRRLVTGGFYVIDDGEGNATYKRFQANPIRFEPVSKNKALPTIYPDNEPTIVGRVKLTMLDLT